MGALSGSITTTAYYVDGDLPKGFRERYVAALGARRFRDVDPSADVDESIGWVSAFDPFDTDFQLDKVLWGDYLMVGLRQDLIRLPATALKLHFRQALAEYLGKTGRERATKAEEEEVRDQVEKQLKRRVLPAIRVNDLVWNIERGQVWFFSANKRLNEVVMDLFTETFEVTLIPRNPYALLERLKLGDELIDKAVTLEPTVFAVPQR